MKLHEEKLNVEGGFTPRREKSFGIAPSMIGHVMKILSDMYSDPHRAIAREYIANAVDSHRMARKLNAVNQKPIEVTTPSKLNPTFSVRDYGVGMSEEETEELLSNFGSSGDEKRKDDTLIGGFGIGSKCAFAVTDTYTFTVWHGGREKVWICTIKKDAARSIQQLTDQASDEPTGVRVDVPVNFDQSSKVVDGVNYVLSCLDEPIVLNGELFIRSEWGKAKVCNGISIAYNAKAFSDVFFDNTLICGDFSYALPDNATVNAIGYEGLNFFREIRKLGGTSSIPNVDTNKAPVLAALLHPTTCLHMEGGLLRPAPNRENIIFDKAAEQHIAMAYSELKKAVSAELTVITSAAASPLDVLRLVESIDGTALGSVKISPTWNGKKITFADIPGLESSENIYFPYARNVRGRTHRRYKVASESLPARITDLGDHAVADRKDIARVVSREWVELEGKLYTTRKYSIIEAEPMGKGHLVESLTRWWDDRRAEKEVAGLAHAYNALATYNINVQHIVVMGTEAERKAKIAELEWCTKCVLPDVAVKPPKKPKIPRTPGAPRTNSDPICNRGWMANTPDGWMQCFRPQALPKTRVVYVVDRPEADLARSLCHMHELWDSVIPDYKDTSVYALTPDAYERVSKCDGYELVKLSDAVKEWMETWCAADSDQQSFGAEMFLKYYYSALFNNAISGKLQKSADIWGLAEIDDLLIFVDARDKWYFKTDRMQGEFKKLIERLLLRSNPTAEIPGGLRNGLHSKTAMVSVVLDYVRRTAGCCDLSETAEASVMDKFALLYEPFRSLLDGKPERAAIFKEQIQFGYCNEVHTHRQAWDKAMFAMLNIG